MRTIGEFLLILILISILPFSPANAEIHNVPEEFETIQAAIDESEDGDTVLVQPGEYAENIDFDGKAITVASLFLTAHNPAYIDSTLIDGNEEGSVVVFNSGEDENSVLTGFTIINGEAENGGGIHSNETGPTLSNLIVRNCSAEIGGGVYGIASTMRLFDVELRENTADFGGGFAAIYESDITYMGGTIIDNEGNSSAGVFLRWSSAEMAYILVKDNYPAAQMGIFEIFGWDGEYVELRNLTVVSDGSSGMGLDAEYPDILMRNLIVQGHEHDNVHSGASNLIYSCVEGEPDRNNCIDEDPLFVDPENGDYTLQQNSPCIDSGDPDSPPDPDSSRADMGAFPWAGGAYADGFILDAEDNRGIPNARILTSNNQTAVTDSSGYWQITPLMTGVFDITASADGYNDSTFTELEANLDDTLRIDFALLHPEIEISIVPDLNQVTRGDTLQFEISIANDGSGTLEWELERRVTENAENKRWGLVESIPLSDITNDTRLESVTYGAGTFFVAGRNSDGEARMIYRVSRDGELVDQFSQPNPEDRSGMKNVAWDENSGRLWGGIDQTVYALSENGEVAASFDVDLGGNATIQAVTWDEQRNIVWVSGVVSDISGYSPEGEQIATIERGDFRVYGLASWENDPDGKSLYVFHRDGEGKAIYKANPDSGEWIQEYSFQLEDGEEPRGINISTDFIPMAISFMSIIDNPEGDRLNVWQLAADFSWFRIDTLDGFVDAGEEQVLNGILDAREMDTGSYVIYIFLRHNATGGSAIIPVEIEVTDPNYVTQLISAANDFSIDSIYPNPFNSTTTVSYSLPNSSMVSLKLFDLSGREVKSLINGRMEAGKHRISISGDGLASGLYVLRVRMGSYAGSRKILLVR